MARSNAGTGQILSQRGASDCPPGLGGGGITGRAYRPPRGLSTASPSCHPPPNSSLLASATPVSSLKRASPSRPGQLRPEPQTALEYRQNFAGRAVSIGAGRPPLLDPSRVFLAPVGLARALPPAPPPITRPRPPIIPARPGRASLGMMTIVRAARSAGCRPIPSMSTNTERSGKDQRIRFSHPSLPEFRAGRVRPGLSEGPDLATGDGTTAEGLPDRYAEEPFAHCAMEGPRGARGRE